MWDDTGVLSLGSLDKIKDIQAQWVSAHCSIRLRTGVEPDVVFSCCSPSASRLEMFCEMLFCSSRVCRVVIWVTLAFLSAQTGLAVPLWPQDISVCRTGCVFFSFFHTIPCEFRLIPTTAASSKSLWSIRLFLHSDVWREHQLRSPDLYLTNADDRLIR